MDGNAAARKSPLAMASAARHPKPGWTGSASATCAAPFDPTSTACGTSGLERAPERPLFPLHPARLRRRALVVVAQEMEEAVHEQPLALGFEGMPVRRGLAARRVDRDDHVAEERLGERVRAVEPAMRPARTLVVPRRATRRPAMPRVPLRKGQHVGRTILRAPVAIELLDD